MLISVCLHMDHSFVPMLESVCIYMNAVHRELILFSQGVGTPLHSASTSGQTAVVSLLLDHGADVHAKGWVSICSDYHAMTLYVADIVFK